MKMLTTHYYRKYCTILISLFLLTSFLQAAHAAVSTCDALTLYGNAVNERLCKSLSPGTQNLWVCELAGGSTDIHTTFNAATDLHVTVRINPGMPTCQGNSTLNGTFPGAITITPGQPTSICGVSVTNYRNRLNAVARVPAGGTTFCRAAFIEAQNNLRITPAIATSYINLCTAQACL